MLKYVVKTLEELDDSVKSLYKLDDASGDYVLQVEGASPKSKVDEFRNSNIDLKNRLAKFDGVDLDEIASLRAAALDGSKFTEEDVETMVNDRVKSMKSQLEGENESLKTQLGKSNTMLDSLLIDSAIRREGASAGVIPEAMDDVVLRARSVFKVVDGVATPFDHEGKVVYGRDADTAKSVGEWVTDLNKSAAHLFTPPKGAGLGGSNSGQGADTSKLAPHQKISAALDS